MIPCPLLLRRHDWVPDREDNCLGFTLIDPAHCRRCGRLRG